MKAMALRQPCLKLLAILVLVCAPSVAQAEGTTSGAEAGRKAMTSVQEAARADIAPATVVEAFQQALLRAAAEAACAARADQLSVAVDALFDMPAIARRVLRRHWGGLDASARRDFVDALHELTVLGYATRFTAREARFGPVEERRRQGVRVQVQSALQRPDKAPVPFSYLLATDDDRWRIVNVVVDGVSELSLRSAQYGALVQRDGFPALMDRMNRQIEETRATCE